MHHDGQEKNLTEERKRQLLELLPDDFHPLVEIGQLGGPEALDILTAVMGGQKPHIPSNENLWVMFEREVRDINIRHSFKGNNYEQLALDHGITEAAVRKIVHDRKKKKRPPESCTPVKVSNDVYERVGVELARYNAQSIRELVSVVLDVAIDLPEVHDALRRRFGEQLQLAANDSN